jgi:hypothetical protein
VALWIEALEPGKPLTFLDARIRCGDSLIGVFDYAMLQDGIPDAAYKPLTGDDKDAARAWAKLNRGQRDGKAKDSMLAEIRPPAGLLDQARAIHQMPEDSLEQIGAKQGALARLHAGSWLHLKAACDLYVAAFFSPKTEPPPSSPVGLATAAMPLTDHVLRAAAGHRIFSKLFTEADRIAHAVHAFHWPLEFPDILAPRRLRRRGRQPALGANQAPGGGVLRLPRHPDSQREERRGPKETDRRVAGDQPRSCGRMGGRRSTGRERKQVSSGCRVATPSGVSMM